MITSIYVLGQVFGKSYFKLQYQMLNVLFDVAKTVSLRESEDDDLFLMVMEIANSFLALDLDTAGLS